VLTSAESQHNLRVLHLPQRCVSTEELVCCPQARAHLVARLVAGVTLLQPPVLRQRIVMPRAKRLRLASTGELILRRVTALSVQLGLQAGRLVLCTVLLALDLVVTPAPQANRVLRPNEKAH
jgi:hypothetical protein